jgi:hypothetical protein
VRRRAGPHRHNRTRLHPAGFTPNAEDGAQIPDATVNALLQRGATMYAGGRFHTVSDGRHFHGETRWGIAFCPL